MVDVDLRRLRPRLTVTNRLGAAALATAAAASRSNHADEAVDVGDNGEDEAPCSRDRVLLELQPQRRYRRAEVGDEDHLSDFM